jgi:D-amino-acid dehydrogenase
MRIAVVGAGIAGITAAYYAAEAGATVAVFDQEPYAAMRTSFANGGQVSVSNSEVWTTWSNVRKGIRWMFKKDAPLLIRPDFEWDKIKWLAKFLKHTANNEYYQNTVDTIRMGLASRILYKDLIAREKLEFDQTPAGILHFYKDTSYLQHAVKAQAIYDQEECEWTMLTPEQVYDKDPALANITDIVGGAWTGDDWTGDIHKFCYLLAKKLKSRSNVLFYYNHDVDSINELLIDFDVVIVSAGVGSKKLAKTIGDDLPIYPVKGYSITINNVDSQNLPRVSLLDDQAKIVTSTLGNRLRVAGTAELAGENYDIRRDRIEPLLKWVHENFPKINTHDYSTWACLRPMTPNMLPIVRASDKNRRVFYNTGHGHLGWTLAPYTAKKIVDEIIKGE